MGVETPAQPGGQSRFPGSSAQPQPRRHRRAHSPGRRGSLATDSCAEQGCHFPPKSKLCLLTRQPDLCTQTAPCKLNHQQMRTENPRLCRTRQQLGAGSIHAKWCSGSHSRGGTAGVPAAGPHLPPSLPAAPLKPRAGQPVADPSPAGSGGAQAGETGLRIYSFLRKSPKAQRRGGRQCRGFRVKINNTGFMEL